MNSATDDVNAALKRMDPSRLVNSLDPTYLDRGKLLCLAVAYVGFGNARCVSGRRGLRAQQMLYGQGRSAEECRKAGVPADYSRESQRQVTWCRPEESGHVGGRALDFDVGGYAETALPTLKHAADLLGCVWGGDWKVRDYGHFEWPEGSGA